MTEPTVQESQQASVAVSSPRVMIVDDSKSAAEIMAMFFEMEGLETAVAFDGLEAIEKAASFLPDIIFMDLTMPRMDGFEAARHLRASATDVLLIALTGWESDGDRQRSLDAGFNFHMVKPVKPDDLRLVISGYGSQSRVVS